MDSFLDSWLDLENVFRAGPTGRAALEALAGGMETIAQDADEVEATGAFPDATYRALHSAGLMGAVIPKPHGGRGLSDEEYCLFIGRLAAANPSAALAFNMHSAALVSVDAFGSHELKEECFDLVCGQGAKVAGLGSEPGLKLMATGAPPLTTISVERDQYRLTGVKSYSSFGSSADLLYVTCQMDGQVVFALVDAHADGVIRGDDWDVTAMRSTQSVTTHFDEVLVPRSRIVIPDDPFEALLFETEFALGYGPIYLAMAARALRLAFKPITRHSSEPPSDIWFERIGHAYSEFTAAALVCRDAATAHPKGELLRARDIIMAKGLACRKAQDLTELALEAVGGRSLRTGDQVGRLCRDIRAGLVMAFSPAEAKLLIGRVLLGHPPEFVKSQLFRPPRSKPEIFNQNF